MLKNTASCLKYTQWLIIVGVVIFLSMSCKPRIANGSRYNQTAIGTIHIVKCQHEHELCAMDRPASTAYHRYLIM